MDKKSKIYLYIIFGVVAILLFLELITPQPLSWEESYTSGDKIPFGAYILYDQLDDLFEDDVESIKIDPVSFLKEHEDVENANYIFINNYLGFDRTELRYLMEFAERGNKVFVSTESVTGALGDSLKVDSNRFYSYYEQDTVRVRLNNPVFENRSYIYQKGSSYRHFTSYDTTRTTVLGEVLPFEPVKGYLKNILGEDFGDQADSTKTIIEKAIEKSKSRQVPQANFIELKVGDGAIYYHLNPIAFTNYYMLEEGKKQYVTEMFSYLNDGPVYFDDYGKSGRRVVASPMRFILTNGALKWAWYITLGTILLYFIFKAKREQRAIPVVKPLANSTVEFTKTIGNLYYQSGDVSGIINKKINFFLEKLRTKYFVNTQQLDDVFIKRLAVKAGVSHDQTQEIIEYINHLRSKPVHSEHELKQLNKRIDAFFKD
ncbi:uncharacterized protein DUF4350 [Nonlabens xylanidelens]|uniref:Uncharacterized protein DUF4350 n=1 Tax=Nonlabens xylanidelens TaxID=191564 RepID=A0A2S6ILF2_9FLAO|nr:DUF4350 domain-containing protein [Nonlabens xylanidelens]PPK95005.1 uncharacterized protein DUF4350 [Nonlabens xylanidelens]PQJ17546.1 hypothetical protein BST94_10860 [Nonlabens xylanidelens]